MNNLGETSLRRKRAANDPMYDYDRLPPELRHWLAQAALPWSPTSAYRIWQRARKQGYDSDAILNKLAQAEAKTLTREKVGRLR